MMISKMKSVKYNNRKKSFTVTAGSNEYAFPYAKSNPKPTSSNPIVELYVDKELDKRGFTYVLKSGKEGTVLLDQVLDYNKDPEYEREILLQQLTAKACKILDSSQYKGRKREIMRRMNTSQAQFYRLIDPGYSRKTIDQMVKLLSALDCKVEISVA